MNKKRRNKLDNFSVNDFKEMNQVTKINRGFIKDNIANCICGEKMYLKYKNIPYYFENIIIHVLQVPIYVCNNCGEESMSGPICQQLAKRIRESIKLGQNTIEF